MLFATHIIILVEGFLNLVNNSVQASEDLGGIRVFYSFLFMLLFNPLAFFLFYRGTHAPLQRICRHLQGQVDPLDVHVPDADRYHLLAHLFNHQLHRIQWLHSSQPLIWCQLHSSCHLITHRVSPLLNGDIALLIPILQSMDFEG